jgi:hypothetical protein
MCFFYSCHHVLAALNPGALVSVRLLSTRPFALQCYYNNVILCFYMFVCFCVQHSRVDGWVGVISQIQFVFSYENLSGQAWGNASKTRFKPRVANCFATECSKALTPKILFSVKCFGVLFEIDLLVNTCIFSPRFGCVGRLIFWTWQFLVCIFLFFTLEKTAIRRQNVYLQTWNTNSKWWLFSIISYNIADR